MSSPPLTALGAKPDAGSSRSALRRAHNGTTDPRVAPLARSEPRSVSEVRSGRYGHETLPTEIVVAGGDGYLVVRKQGDMPD
jgi:hypothetical protein